MAWTRQIIWKKEHPDLFAEIMATEPEEAAIKYGRFYWHGSFGNMNIDNRYLDSLKKEIPYHGNSIYSDVLKDDLMLHKMALARNDCCFQLVDKEIKLYG